MIGRGGRAGVGAATAARVQAATVGGVGSAAIVRVRAGQAGRDPADAGLRPPGPARPAGRRWTKINVEFYRDPADGVFKALLD